MSNNIYDILSKLPKDNSISVVEAETIYESVDSEDSLLEDIICLEEKYKKFNPNDEDETKYLNPQAKRFVQLAKAKFPETSSDLEAVVAAVGDKTEELDERDRDTAEWISKAKSTISQQQREIEQTEQAVNDANARYDAQEKRFQDFTRQVAAAELDVKQQAQAAVDFAQQPEAQPQAVIQKVKAQQPAPEPTALPDVTVAQPVAQQQTTPEPEQTSTDTTQASNVVTLKQPKQKSGGKVSKAEKQDVTSLWGQAAESKTLKKKMLEQQDLASGIASKNWQIIQNNRLVPPPSTELIFGDKVLPLKPLDVQALWTYFMKKSTKNIGKPDQFTDEVMLNNLVKSTLNNPITVNYLLGTKEISNIQKVLRSMQTKLRKSKQTSMDLDKPEQPKQNPVQQPQQTQQPGLATTPFGKYIQQKATEPPQQGDLFGNPTMNENIKNIAESLMERFMSFKEEAKPDFLDLDKDGDTEEPMKKAAKDAKEHEPAKVDKDAVAKRKRLQALKDKQEDERAEKGDYDDEKSSSRKIKGRAYGGAAQKDDEEKDLDEAMSDAAKLERYNELIKRGMDPDDAEVEVFNNEGDKDLDESGLQAYLGKKKYGKEGMQALQKAGREGASKEKMALIRARHDKMDEANWLPGQKGIPVPNPQDAITKKPGYIPPPKYVPNKPGEIEEVSYSAKAARAGKDIGKPGKAFAKIAKSAGERYGSKERGEKVAGAVLAKLRTKESVEDHAGMRKPTKADTPEYHTLPVDKAAAEKRKQLQALKDRQEDKHLAKKDDLGEVTAPPKYVPSGNPLPNTKQVGTKYTPQGTPVPVMAPKKPGELEEVAPPGAKAERMVKHIKKGYSKDGKLTPKEKGIAYATAWKAHNKGQVEEATKFGDTIKNSKAELKKHKMVHEGRNPESSEYTYETVGRILSEEQPGLDCNSEAFVKAVYDELIELKMTPKAARWLVHYDEDFISDTASAYSHFCDSKEKEAMECGAPINSFVSEEPLLDAQHELNEIARLAGLESTNESSCMVDEEAINEAATRKDFRMVADLLKSIPDIAKRTELAMYHADIFKQQNPRFKKEMFLAAAGVDTTPIKDVEDEVLVGEAEVEVEEGNEFSGALAKARAEGKKEFEVDGKKYTVKEDININVSANGEEDVVNLIRKLSGMPVVAIQAQPAVAEEVVAEEGPKERDVEYTNTPREEVAGTDAAIPAGADLNRAKKQYKKEYPGDNPMAVAEAKEEQLWRTYESMINDLKA